jgi:prolyl oligopeptidase
MKINPTLALFALMTTTIASAHAAPPAEDPNLWLEDVLGAKPLDWVKQENAKSTGELAGTPEFKALQGRFLEILDSKDRIPAVTKYGAYYYNFWRDAEHPRGLWRRTTLEEYRKDSPAWEPVLDLDALGKAENESWVWKGASVLQPECTHCLLSLSRGGADATVIREFNLEKRQFVPGGFTLPESKSNATWLDDDHLYVGMAFDSTTMTESGYPREVRLWTRDTPLSEATLVTETRPADVRIFVYRNHTPGFERDFVYRALTIFDNELSLLRDGKVIRIDKPDDARATAWRDWLLIRLRTPWTVGGQTYAGGSLLAANFDDFIAGKREMTSLFTPTPRTSLAGYSTARHAVILTVLDNVRDRIYVAKPVADGWSRTPVEGLPQFGRITVDAVDEMSSDEYWLSFTDFLTPSSLYLASVDSDSREKLKQMPALFDASRDEVSQHEAVSKDGTRIPYFEVAPKSLKDDGSGPTLMVGYGGFEISEQPSYSGITGTGWLERGGVYVLANIRGGGEFGPEWHEAAIKQNRQRCYEDFSAVARDLIARKVTSPARLGCLGGSNGGLLVGNMITQYPDLFGAVVCEQPLLDMKRYSHLLAGASWMGEYGDPDKPEEWSFMKPWSPYQNVRAGVNYPRTLFTSSTRDDRVHPGHARKMVARMQAQGADVLYYENIEGGHAGAADSNQRSFMAALVYTFLWKQLGGPGM